MSRKERKIKADKKRGMYVRLISDHFGTIINKTRSYAKAQDGAQKYVDGLIARFAVEADLIRQAARSIKTIGYR